MMPTAQGRHALNDATVHRTVLFDKSVERLRGMTGPNYQVIVFEVGHSKSLSAASVHQLWTQLTGRGRAQRT